MLSGQLRMCCAFERARARVYVYVMCARVICTMWWYVVKRKPDDDDDVDDVPTRRLRIESSSNDVSVSDSSNENFVSSKHVSF